MSDKLQGIVDQIKELTLLEASELVKLMEETFGVSAAAASVAMTAVTDGNVREANAIARLKRSGDGALWPRIRLFWLSLGPDADLASECNWKNRKNSCLQIYVTLFIPDWDDAQVRGLSVTTFQRSRP